ncbi:MAG: ABC transporter ATP-binding protein [Flavobacteriales bacterium]|nr:ABC transporter ATP-binding protein [Flavobacteriales bacterium]
MSNTVISVEGLSKQYRLGMVGAGTLREDLIGWWYRMRGKEDPYLKIGETNDRSTSGTSDYVWALKDVSFDVAQGEVLGIIGKNGAGKSTLLKLLSRVTSPTLGTVKAKGRIASLLEVGTGFHPELTGRENIYLNGAIMGMRRAEITRKLDEIIDFAGVQRYVDTPVKRYSSGMYVRLAFAVAAHLEPEILIVDEVLAVGDAEFQKKAIGKMQEVSSGTGRTVLFVSHNMASVKTLCSRALLMRNGQLAEQGSPSAMVDAYLKSQVANQTVRTWENGANEDNGYVQIKEVRLVNRTETDKPIYAGDEFAVRFKFNLNLSSKDLINLSVNLFHLSGQIIFNSVSDSIQADKGNLVCEMIVPKNLMNNGLFRLMVMVAQDRSRLLFKMDEALTFEIHDRRDENEKWFGDMTDHIIRPVLNWNMDMV